MPCGHSWRHAIVWHVPELCDPAAVCHRAATFCVCEFTRVVLRYFVFAACQSRMSYGGVMPRWRSGTNHSPVRAISSTLPGYGCETPCSRPSSCWAERSRSWVILGAFSGRRSGCTPEVKDGASATGEGSAGAACCAQTEEEETISAAATAWRQRERGVQQPSCNML